MTYLFWAMHGAAHGGAAKLMIFYSSSVRVLRKQGESKEGGFLLRCLTELMNPVDKFFLLATEQRQRSTTGNQKSSRALDRAK